MGIEIIKSGDSLPSQSGHSGEILTTDGSTASWTAVGAGTGDVIGAGTPTVGDLVQATDADGKHIAPATQIHYNAVDHGSAVRHTSNDVGATFRAWLAGLTNCTVVFPPGTYSLTSDLTTPTTVHLILMRGAFFKPGKVAQTMAPWY